MPEAGRERVTFKLKIKWLFRATKCTATQHQPSFPET